MRAFLTFLVFLAIGAGAYAQDDGPSRIEAAAQKAKERVETRTAVPAGQSELESDLRFLLDEFYGPRPEPADAEQAAFRAAMTKVFVESYAPAIAAHFDYRTQGFDHRRRTFEWQLASSRIIFFAVIGLVVAGVVFSALQFRQAMNTPAVSKGEGQEGTGGLKSALELSPNGVKVTSNVLGVVILALSLGFFYLYVKYIYEIQEIL